MPRKKSPKPGRCAPPEPGLLEVLKHPHAAGIDVGAEELVAAVPASATPGAPVRTFSGFTAGVLALCEWLLSCGIKTVAMEPSGAR
jgi:hypothetical protein